MNLGFRVLDTPETSGYEAKDSEVGVWDGI